MESWGWWLPSTSVSPWWDKVPTSSTWDPKGWWLPSTSVYPWWDKVPTSSTWDPKGWWFPLTSISPRWEKSPNSSSTWERDPKGWWLSSTSLSPWWEKSSTSSSTWALDPKVWWLSSTLPSWWEKASTAASMLSWDPNGDELHEPKNWCETVNVPGWWCPPGTRTYEQPPIEFDLAVDKWDEKAKVEFQLELIEVPVSMIALLLNLYCIIVILGVKNTRRLDYLLIFFQTVVDFVCSGLLGLIYYIYKLRYNASRACGADELHYLDVYKTRLKNNYHPAVYHDAMDVRWSVSINSLDFSCIFSVEKLTLVPKSDDSITEIGLMRTVDGSASNGNCWIAPSQGFHVQFYIQNGLSAISKVSILSPLDYDFTKSYEVTLCIEKDYCANKCRTLIVDQTLRFGHSVCGDVMAQWISIEAEYSDSYLSLCQVEVYGIVL
ncbi:uncharacterized protein LOC142354190 [Convolutriloba macropyga]|uniref:uncharacterized protein LOC142354190 n=1 Tax=Convolutriloba macropyga TaxID=536237 RepID=UPI003F5216EE